MKHPDHNARYWAYSNYLIAFSFLLEEEHPTITDLAHNIAGLSGFDKIKRRKTANIEDVAKMLRQSWFTELLLWAENLHPEIVRYATPWSMVQAYYAIHASIRAYFYATERNIENAHEKTLRQMSEDLIHHKNRFPSPWRCVLIGNPRVSPLPLANTSCNGAQVMLKNALASPYNGFPCQHFGLFLKTTRTRRLEGLVDEWKRKERKTRLPVGQYKLLAEGLRPTSIFDALYRIRTRSNYQDIDSFTFSNATADDAKYLQNAICNIVNYTLMVFEMMITNAVGKEVIERVINGFVSTELGTPANQTILVRWNAIKGVF